MNVYRWCFFLGFCLSNFVFADTAFTPPNGGMSFSPSVGDYSIIFLGNLFGDVNGVLHGTGSQIMGVMLGVFNSAVLALGGVIVMYIILVSTLNTAHEGEMLGHKWSSIWVPIRTVIGLSLLIPKTSGYCLMQIFVMWVVVQGVGVADKIWGSALGYLNRGGTIIHANLAPKMGSVMGKENSASIEAGAAAIFYGQVCMAATQAQLESVRTSYLNQASSGTGPCAGSPSSQMTLFCNTPVPDFISSVDPMTVQLTADASSNSAPGTYRVPMPNIDASSPYAFLNGICGTLKWNAVSEESLVTTDPSTGAQTSTITSLSMSDLDIIKMTRSLAVTQMYNSLANTAKMIVNNDPQINPSIAPSGSTSAATVAQNQFGLPLSGNNVCSKGSSDCLAWGGDPSVALNSSVLLQGSEFKNSVSDYNTMMAPTLNLMNQANDVSAANSSRKFIQTAETSGWISAGSYFYDLVNLNGSVTAHQAVDQNSGLNSSTPLQVNDLTSAFSNNGCSGLYENLCLFFNKDVTYMQQVAYLIDGSAQAVVAAPSFNDAASSFPIYTGTQADCVYGYVSNAMNLVLPDQPGLSGPDINLDKLNVIPHMNLNVSWTPPKMSSKCTFKVLGTCIPLGKWIINPVVQSVFQWYFMMLNGALIALNALLNYMIAGPIYGYTYIFTKAMGILSTPGINPVLALAKMGVTFIDFSMDLWLILAVMAIAAGFVPYVGAPLFALLMIFSPLFFAWLAVMLGIAFVTAYYVPFLPYLLFTFGAIGWLITVIEAMVAAPIVALGVAHPEGHDALGKSEQGLMILLNVFLRPGMMVIGYISGIALCYVSVWLLNTGFQHLLDFMNTGALWLAPGIPWTYLFGFFFSSLLYISMYLTVVQKSFSLISVLPDKVLRWVGGQAEQTGQESSQWMEETKGQVKEGSEPTSSGASQVTKQGVGQATKALGQVRASMTPKGEGGHMSLKPGSGGGSGAGGGPGGGSSAP